LSFGPDSGVFWPHFGKEVTTYKQMELKEK